MKLETERQHILEELEEKKRKISEEADAYDDKFFKVQEVLDRLREGKRTTICVTLLCDVIISASECGGTQKQAQIYYFTYRCWILV